MNEPILFKPHASPLTNANRFQETLDRCGVIIITGNLTFPKDWVFRIRGNTTIVGCGAIGKITEVSRPILFSFDDDFSLTLTGFCFQSSTLPAHRVGHVGRVNLFCNDFLYSDGAEAEARNPGE